MTPSTATQLRMGLRAKPWATATILLVAIALICAAPSGLAAARAEDDFDEIMAEAKNLMRQRKYDEALRLYRRANNMKGKTCVDCLWGMAQAYSRLGAHKNVLETCDQVVLVAGGDREAVARAQNLKGLTFSSQAMDNRDRPDARKLADAEIAFRRTLESDPDFIMARYNLGVTLIRLGKEPDGLAELKKFVEDYEGDEDLVEDARKMIANPRRAKEDYAPEFSITTPQGEYIASEDLLGKVVLVDFWGTWCPPCVASIPSLARLNKRFAKDPFVLISVSSDNDKEAWRKFVEKNKMVWPQFLDTADKVQRAFQVRSFPTYILVDHEGIIRHRSSGFGDYVESMIESSVKKALKSLAKAPPPKPAEQRAEAQTASPSDRSTGNRNDGNMTPREPMQAQRAEAAAQSKESASLPAPVLAVLGGEEMQMGSMRMNRYPLQIKNWETYSKEIFEAAKDLQPCGMGAHATRAELTVWSESGQRLVTYCDLSRAEMLERVWLVLPQSETPERIYVVLRDRRSGADVRSNLADLPAIKQASPAQ